MLERMQPPTDNLYKFLAIFGLLVAAFSIYVPLLRYMEFNRLQLRADAIYGPMLDPLRVISDESMAELECSIYQAHLREKTKPPTPDPCPKVAQAKATAVPARAEVARLRLQLAPLEVERSSVWQEYVLFLYVGVFGLALGIAMCVSGFWLWYVRLQRHLDASVKAQAISARRLGTVGRHGRREA
jgi:hypothetical protein